MIDDPITSVKGIGKIRASYFEKMGVFTVGDLIRLYPRDYLDYSSVKKIEDVSDKNAAYSLTVLSQPTVSYFHGISLVSCKATDGESFVTLKWYNMPYQRGRITSGDRVIACGKIDKKHGKSLLNPVLYSELPGIIPVYPAVKGLKQASIRSSIRAAIETAIDEIRESVPKSVSEKYGLISGKDAFKTVHFPETNEALVKARKRIAFETILQYLVAVNERKQEMTKNNGISFKTDGCRERFSKMIPFSLTNAQLRVCGDIENDMRALKPMNRLVQGDVGSGKTILAVYAMFIAGSNGFQSAMLAPTEILARQHFEDISRYFPGRTVLLLGGMNAREKNTALKMIASGEAEVVIGTHALLSENVLFRSLGLTITDEQHRFGVLQRAGINLKGIRPDTLVMSATPIPRTLSLLMYGDLDVSNVDEMPPGRLPVKTRYISREKRKQMYDYIVSEAEQGNACYIVCPFIDEPEEGNGQSVNGLYSELKKLYPHAKLEVLHGGMKREEKDSVMEKFRNGELRILISTTVIEVGVHVESANIMVIEDAERFGLAQLHQLRGRVGRGKRQAYCFLLSNADGESAYERLSAMVETNDGFEISEKDLQMRGPGDFFGTRQHGSPVFENLFSGTNMKFISEIKQAADDIIEIPNVENNEFIELAKNRYSMMNRIVMN